MHGQIIGYDNRMASGKLRCSKGQEYEFAQREWQSRIQPRVGQRVSFNPVGHHATGVQPHEMPQTSVVSTDSTTPDPAQPATVAPAAAAEQPTTSSLAVVSLVAGIVGLFFFGSLVAVICGHIARSQIRQSQGKLTGDGLAIGGLIMGYFALILSVLFALGIASAVYMANDT
ncbi:DUF4190 domain-containing protein [Halopseudomonas salegens]|uniref:DUF4190 domain-containing protein n=1 Tax=Halopseudomonas salegens TaxID=1434072 RepID=A0A1H2GJC5_9GAMM|nr:DUF4190 domain-containing protein [Halopseudomonas salegens]SDU19559.1 protein of unknown function [Halopseudomonas salegens]